MVETEVCQMAFSPKEAPVYGGGTIVVVFSDDVKFPHDAQLYLVYEGSQNRHVTTTRQVNDHTLHSIIPGHDIEEDIQIGVRQWHDGSIRNLAQDSFSFKCDSAFHLAQFLVDSVYNPSALDSLELIKSKEFDLANEVLSTLDTRLSRALKNIVLPDGWHLLGGIPDQEYIERETLLHFCANLELFKVAEFLLDKPGSQIGVRLPNRHGQLPCDIASDHGYHSLAELLSGYNTHGLVTEEDQHLEIENGVIRSHGNETTSLTTFLYRLPRRTVEQDIDMLQGVQMMMKRGHSPSYQRHFQTEWPEPPENSDLQHPDLADLPYDDQLEQVIDRIFQEQQAHQQFVNAMQDPHHSRMEDGEESMDCQVEGASYGPGVARTGAVNVAEELVQDTGGGRRGILEESLTTLRGINEGLLQRRNGKLATQLLTQNVRKENLSRFSSSCPSLDVRGRISPLSPIDEGGHHRSMLDLAEEVVLPTHNPTVCHNRFHSHHLPGAATDSLDSSIQICVNGVTLDSTADFREHFHRHPNDLLPQFDKNGDPSGFRRRSWCPDGVDSSRSPQKQDRIRVLALTGKSMSLNSLDGDEESEEEDFQDAQEQHAPQRSRVNVHNDASDVSTNAAFHDDRSLSPVDSMESSPPGRRMPNVSDYVSRVAKDIGSSASARSLSDIPYEMEAESEVQPAESKVRTYTVAATQGIRSYDEDDRMLGIPHSNMTKSLSTPSIPAASEAVAAMEDRKLSFRRDGQREGKHPANFQADERAKMIRKEEDRKKRKTSVFSRFQSSYRTKKNKEKENKGKNTHQFVSISFSNSAACDFCHKPMANKPALRCENCLVSVHEHSCKDHISPCDKHRHVKALSHDGSGSTTALHERQTALSQGLALRPTHSMKDKRSTSDPVRSQGQTQQAHMSHRHSLPVTSHTISEESETDSVGQSSDLGQTNITETQSESLESLDVGTTDFMTLVDDEPDLMLGVDEPEAWNITVDRKTLKKYSAKDTKRQDTIWELIQTEKQYCRSLKVMQKLFCQGLVTELDHLQDPGERLFPRLDDLLDIHTTFLRQLIKLQSQNPDRSVDSVGHVLVEQFDGDSAERMKAVYGEFCSKHKESVQLYKDILKTDRKFHNYVKKCANFSWCKRREIPDFILGVTVRLSKYPILIEAILKSTKDKKDRENLSRALQLSKAILTEVNESVASYEQLMEIQNRMDSRSTTTFKGKKFKKQDISAGNRKLLHAGLIGWKSARGRVYDVLAAVLSDLIFFAREDSGPRYSFFLQDNKSCVVPLFKLLVREKRDTRDSHGIYLISQNRHMPEMYELVCRSKDDKEEWMRKLQWAIANCPQEEENVSTELDEERRRQEEVKATKIKEIIDQMQTKDMEIKSCCDEKNRLLRELHQHTHSMKEETQAQPGSQEEPSGSESLLVLQAAIQEASRLTSFLQGTGTPLSRSVSSVGEHVSSSFQAIPVPKRAETFAGFDNSYDIAKRKEIFATAAIKKRLATTIRDDTGRSTSLQSLDTSDPEQRGAGSQEPHPGEQRMSYPGAISSAIHTQIARVWEDGGLGASSDKSSEGGSLGELPSSTLTSLPVTTPASSEEQMPMVSIAQLLKYLHDLMHLTAQQGTAVESLRVQLNAANEKINKLSVEMTERGDRRFGYSHNQLEELRNLQENISREKQEWEREKAREKAALEKEKNELNEQRLELLGREAEIAVKREDLKRQRETLQRQIDMLREQTAPSPRGTLLEYASSSSPTMNPASSGQSVSLDKQREMAHRRSVSADFSHSPAQNMDNFPAYHPGDPTRSLGEVRGNNRHPRQPVSNVHSFGAHGAKQNLPVHLLSAKNEQKLGGIRLQGQLPLKLSSSAGQAGSTGQQALPYKLSSSQPGHHSSSHSTSAKTHIASSHSSSAVSPPHSLLAGLSKGGASHSAPSNLALIMKLAESSPSKSSSSGSKRKNPSQAAEQSTSAKPRPSGISSNPSVPPNPPHTGTPPGAPAPKSDGGDDGGIIYF